jgi:hypothetical protein
MQVHVFGKKCTSHKNEELNIDKKNVNKEERARQQSHNLQK